MKHVTVCRDADRYFGHPANEGIWMWGNEILIAFSSGYYKESNDDNNFDRQKGSSGKCFARSLDGGETWTITSAAPLKDVLKLDPVPCSGIQFTHPDFALAVKPLGTTFAVSYDRGFNWEGPYEFPSVGDKMKCRTDYIVNSPDDCFFFLSSRSKKIESKTNDIAYCARTTDGGKTIDFLSFIADDKSRSVMPSSVKTPDGKLLSALRRRWDGDFYEIQEIRKSRPDLVELLDKGEKPEEFQSKLQENWIELFESIDNGFSWTSVSRVSVTDTTGVRNGNPPAMVRLQDGRLCVAYGYRGEPLSIRARISNDEGKSWGEEIILREDGYNWDIGYCRMVQRPDGKLVTIYYHSTKEHPVQHIEATIWHPDDLG